MTGKGGFILFCVFLLLGAVSSAQVLDTLSNWDNITPPWQVAASGSAWATNPDPGVINPSEKCLEVITSDGAYDLIYLDFQQAVNFEIFPKYRLKILAPPDGGDVLLKFENPDNTLWAEILATPVPGGWVDLEFDFSGYVSENFKRIAIFFDFLGTTAGQSWYVDDLIRVCDTAQLFQSHLPILVLDTDGTIIPDEPKITANMGIIDNGPGNVNTITDDYNDYDGFIGIEIRGQSSQMFPKKSYTLETRDANGENLNVSLLGMPEENDWVLHAPYSDKSLMRNVLTFDIARSMGSYSSRTAYCEVFLNNEYLGVYVLLEQIKRDDNRVDINELNPEDIAGNELTGGYIIRTDKIDPDFTFGIDGWKSIPVPSYPNAMDIIYQYYYPRASDITFEQKNYIQDHMSNLESVLIGTNFNDPEVGYHKYLDVGSFIDQMILNEIGKEVDGYRYSNYFYKQNISRGGKLFAGPTWDFNLAYGNVDYWEPAFIIHGWIYTDVWPYDYSRMFWWKRLMQDSYFRDLLKTRWIHLRSGSLSSPALLTLVDSLDALLGSAVDRNFDRWPILGEYVWPNYFIGDSHDEEVAYMENFLLDRISWLDDNLPGNELSPVAVLSGDLTRLIIKLKDDYFNSSRLSASSFEMLGAPPGWSIDTVVITAADRAELYLGGTITGPAEIAVKISPEAINTYDYVVSNTFIVAGIQDERGPYQELHIFTAGSTIHIEAVPHRTLSGQGIVYDVSGQKIEDFQLLPNADHAYNTNLLPGLYLLVLHIDGTVQSRKIFIR